MSDLVREIIPNSPFQGIQSLTSPKFLSVSDDFRFARVSTSKKFDCCLASLSASWQEVLSFISFQTLFGGDVSDWDFFFFFICCEV